MRIFQAKLFRVISNTDLTEGRGSSILIGLYLNEHEAKKAAKGRYVMGTDAPIYHDEHVSQLIELNDGSIHVLGILVGKPLVIGDTSLTPYRR